MLLLAVIVATSCRKLGWEKNKDSAECYCLYFSAPGVEKRVSYKYRKDINQWSLSVFCKNKEADLAAKHGLSSNPICSIH